jgi:hypothetical protein
MCKYTDAMGSINGTIKLYRYGLLTIQETLTGINTAIDNFLAGNYKMDPGKRYKSMNRLYRYGLQQIIKYSKILERG